MQIYNTLSRKIEEFVPIDPSNIKIYTCGPTVYRHIHIGNLRTYLTTDVLRRVFLSSNYGVTSVMNITDVGHFRFSEAAGKVIDPVMEEARVANVKPLDIAQKYTDLFLKDCQRLNILPQDNLVKATEHINEMIEIIKKLVDKRIAYVAGGNVYFRVANFRNYGKLSGNTLDKMDQLLEAVRVSVETDKKDSADFALWKKAKSDSVMKWDSPWGEGVPGWHIECTVMAQKYLGNHFDIHAGGEDLIFPHHEDEIAQAEASTGAPFVNYWVHTNFLLIDEEKMSRSKRNVYTLDELIKKGLNALAFRYLTFQTHYRSKMNFTWVGLESAQNALDKVYETASKFPAPTVGVIDYDAEFQEALDQDLNMPKAVSVMWEMLRSDNDPAQKAASLAKMDEVLGLDIFEKAKEMKEIPLTIQELVNERRHFRKNRMFNKADHVRAKIEKLGYEIKDDKNGVVVRKKI